MKNWSRIATWSLLGLLAGNVLGTGYYFVLKHKIAEVRRPPVVEVGDDFPEFSGVDLRGMKWVSHGAPCRVLRITDDQCSFCKKDKPSYTKLLEAARRASCDIIEVAPKAGSLALDPRPGVVQLKFIDADLGSVVGAFVTPQTVVVDRDWKLLSNRRGIFDDKSLVGAVALLESVANGKAGIGN